MAELLRDAMARCPEVAHVPRHAPPYAVAHDPSLALSFTIREAAALAPATPRPAAVAADPGPLPTAALPAAYGLHALSRKVRAQLRARGLRGPAPPPFSDEADAALPPQGAVWTPLFLTAEGWANVSHVTATLQPGNIPVQLRLPPAASAGAPSPSDGPEHIVLQAKLPVEWLRSSLQLRLLQHSEGVQGPLPALQLTVASDLKSESLVVEPRVRASLWAVSPRDTALASAVTAALAAEGGGWIASEQVALTPDAVAFFAPRLSPATWNRVSASWAAGSPRALAAAATAEGGMDAASAAAARPGLFGLRLPPWTMRRGRVQALAATAAPPAPPPTEAVFESHFQGAAGDPNSFASPQMLLDSPPGVVAFIADLDQDGAATCSGSDSASLAALWRGAAARGARVILIGLAPAGSASDPDLTIRILNTFAAAPEDVSSGRVGAVLCLRRRPAEEGGSDAAASAPHSLRQAASGRIQVIAGHLQGLRDSVGRRRGSVARSSKERGDGAGHGAADPETLDPESLLHSASDASSREGGAQALGRELDREGEGISRPSSSTGPVAPMGREVPVGHMHVWDRADLRAVRLVLREMALRDLEWVRFRAVGALDSAHAGGRGSATA